MIQIKKYFRSLAILSAILITITAFSCKNSGASLWDEDSDTYVVTDEDHPFAVAVDDSDKDSEFYADVQADPKDLYLGVFNNSNSSISLPEVNAMNLSGISTIIEKGTISGNLYTKDKSDYNYELMKSLSKNDFSKGISPNFEETLVDPDEVLDQTEDFEDVKQDAYGNIIKYTYSTILKKIVEVSDPTEKALNIWVETSYWDNSTITQEMVDFVADNFLKEGSGNDIYDWVSNIFGDEWGNVDYTYYENQYYDAIPTIPDYNEINIVIVDIHDNNLDDGVVGFFWAKDNFEEMPETDNIPSIFDYSNERITFYIEANYLALLEDGVSAWSETGLYALDTISTLTHEYQHMINFYQTYILNDIVQDTWLNELLSMATEDLVSDPDKLNINGPKGFNTTDGTAPAESESISEGRIPYYNQYPETSYYSWNSNTRAEVLKYYSLNYVYGAYLMRNFGGPEVLKKLYNAETAADIPTVLNFGTNDAEAAGLTVPYLNAAVMLSDRTDAPDYMKFNRGGWFTYTYNSQTYRLSSINFNSYSEPFKIYTKDQAESLGSIGPYSFLFFKEADDISGKYRIGIDSPASEVDTLELLLR